MSRLVFPFTVDSFIYISTAEHIKALHGLLFSNFFIVPPDPDVLPTLLEPPGYPLLISFLGFCGVNEYSAALFWPRLFFLSFPILFFTIFRKIMPQTQAGLAAMICTCMFPLMKCSLMAWTDVPYLFLSLLSIILFCHILEKEGKVSVLFVFISGIVVGFACLTRYIGLTLMTTGLFILTFWFLLKLISGKDFFKISLSYIMGAGLMIIPFLVRNKVVFGTIQPYHQNPSRIPLMINLRDYFQGLAQMIFATATFDKVVVAFMGFIFLILVLRGKSWFRGDKRRFIYILALVCYFVFNSLFLIAYKTIYFGSEDIGERYLLQIGWILMAGIICSIGYVLKKLSSLTAVDIKSTVGLLVLGFCLIQIIPAVDFYFFNQNIKKMSEKMKRCLPIVASLPQDDLIVTNVADITYYFTHRRVRMLSEYLPEDLLHAFSKQKFAVFLVKENDYVSPSYGYAKWWYFPRGYKYVYSDPYVDLLIPQGQ